MFHSNDRAKIALNNGAPADQHAFILDGIFTGHSGHRTLDSLQKSGLF